MFKKYLSYILESTPENKVANPDTLMRLLTELAEENTTATSTSGKKNLFNINEKSNGVSINSYYSRF